MYLYLTCEHEGRVDTPHNTQLSDTSPQPAPHSSPGSETAPNGTEPADQPPFPTSFEPPPKPAYELAARGELHAKTVLKP